jgi:hypothetical protein
LSPICGLACSLGRPLALLSHRPPQDALRRWFGSERILPELQKGGSNAGPVGSNRISKWHCDTADRRAQRRRSSVLRAAFMVCTDPQLEPSGTTTCRCGIPGDPDSPAGPCYHWQQLPQPFFTEPRLTFSPGGVCWWSCGFVTERIRFRSCRSKEAISTRFPITEGMTMQEPPAGLVRGEITLLGVRFIRTFFNRVQDRKTSALAPWAKSSGIASALFSDRVG